MVVGQIVDLAPGFGRVTGGSARLGRDQHGRSMELDDSTPGQLRFRNRGADGLHVTEVHTWDGATRRWIEVKNGVIDRVVGRPAPSTRPAAFIRPTVLPATGQVNRPYAGGLRSVQLKTYHGRRSRRTYLTVDLFDTSGSPMNYHFELALDAVNDALEMGLPVEDGGWTITATAAHLELARPAPNDAHIRIDRALVDQVWAEADRDFPLAD